MDHGTRRSGGHVFVDETKAKDYIMAAACVGPSEVAQARKRLRGLLLPGQVRIHFTHEKDSRRRQIINEMIRLDVEVHIYVARTRDHIVGRRACLEAILETVVSNRAQHLVLELDEPVVGADRRLISERFRREQGPPQYRHLPAKSEPLLWISDAMAWCHQRGGEWRMLSGPLVHEVIDLSPSAGRAQK